MPSKFFRSLFPQTTDSPAEFEVSENHGAPVELDSASLQFVGGGKGPAGTWVASSDVVEGPAGTW